MEPFGTPSAAPPTRLGAGADGNGHKSTANAEIGEAGHIAAAQNPTQVHNWVGWAVIVQCCCDEVRLQALGGMEWCLVQSWASGALLERASNKEKEVVV